MTDRKETPPAEPTIEEIAREEVAEALDRISMRVAGRKTHWSMRTISTMVQPVLVDLNRELQPRPKMPPRPPDYKAKTSPPPKTFAERRAEEAKRGSTTLAEIGEAIRDGR